MQTKHHFVPWFRASEELQASLTLASVTAAVKEVTTDLPVMPTPQQAPPLTTEPVPFASFTTPLPTPQPLPEEPPPLEDTLPYMTEEDVDPSQSLCEVILESLDLEQVLLDEEDPKEPLKLKPPTPSNEDIVWATRFSPSNLRQWDYAISHHSIIMIHYPKGMDPSASLSVAMVEQDLPPEESDGPPAKKPKPKISKLWVWPKKDSESSILYHPPKPDDDDAPPSMV